MRLVSSLVALFVLLLGVAGCLFVCFMPALVAARAIISAAKRQQTYQTFPMDTRNSRTTRPRPARPRFNPFQQLQQQPVSLSPLWTMAPADTPPQVQQAAAIGVGVKWSGVGRHRSSGDAVSQVSLASDSSSVWEL